MSPMDFMPLAAKLGSYIKAGADHYAALKGAGLEVNADTVAVFIEVQMAGWDPVIRGKPALDDASRHHCAQFLGRVIYKLSSPGVA